MEVECAYSLGFVCLLQFCQIKLFYALSVVIVGFVAAKLIFYSGGQDVHAKFFLVSEYLFILALQIRIPVYDWLINFD